jgi:uncharacterized protein
VLVDFVRHTIVAALDILNEASMWLVISFVVGGIMHSLIDPLRMQRSLGNRRLSAVVKATSSGLLLPICSCGVIPIGLSLYYSGAYLGPTLAFMTATPIINPAAVILAYSLLGWKIATIYLITGFAAPILIGVIANHIGGPELVVPGVEGGAGQVALPTAPRQPLMRKLTSGLRWGFLELGTMVSRYVVLGMLIAGLILTAVPPSFIQSYLGNLGALSLVGAAVLGGVMYVCAVGHIPFIAAIVAGGAAPGLAITFLLAGAATNVPELLSIYRTIGRRAVLIYALTLLLTAMVVGYVANLLLGPGFTPVFDTSSAHGALGVAKAITLTAPASVRWTCSAVVMALGIYSVWTRSVVPRLARSRATA